MAHLKKSAITGHLLKNARGHLVKRCRTTTTSTTTTTPAGTTTTEAYACPEDSYCENTCNNTYTLIMGSGLMDCNPDNEDCAWTYSMTDGTACLWNDSGPDCYADIYCSAGHWVTQVTAGASMEQCEWQKPAYSASCPAGTYTYNATGSTCATCPETISIT